MEFDLWQFILVARARQHQFFTQQERSCQVLGLNVLNTQAKCKLLEDTSLDGKHCTHDGTVVSIFMLSSIKRAMIWGTTLLCSRVCFETPKTMPRKNPCSMLIANVDMRSSTSKISVSSLVRFPFQSGHKNSVGKGFLEDLKNLLPPHFLV